jgi:hypothetical protein
VGSTVKCVGISLRKIEVEEKKSMDDVVNYDEVKAQIVERLLDLKNNPVLAVGSTVKCVGISLRKTPASILSTWPPT